MAAEKQPTWREYLTQKTNNILDFDDVLRDPKIAIRRFQHLSFYDKATRIGIIAATIAGGYYLGGELDDTLQDYLSENIASMLEENASVLLECLEYGTSALSYTVAALGSFAVSHLIPTSKLAWDRYLERKDIQSITDELKQAIEKVSSEDKNEWSERLDTILSKNNAPKTRIIQLKQLQRFQHEFYEEYPQLKPVKLEQSTQWVEQVKNQQPSGNIALNY